MANSGGNGYNGGVMQPNGGNNNGAPHERRRAVLPPPALFLPPDDYHFFPRFVHVCCHVISPRSQQAFMDICDDTASVLSQKFGRTYTTDEVANEVIRLRGQYLRFYAWKGKPGVRYNPVTNIVTVTPAYINGDQLRETEEDTSFRLHGFVHFVRLHCIFRKKKAALLPGEPAGNYVDPNVIPYHIQYE